KEGRLRGSAARHEPTRQERSNAMRQPGMDTGSTPRRRTPSDRQRGRMPDRTNSKGGRHGPEPGRTSYATPGPVPRTSAWSGLPAAGRSRRTLDSTQDNVAAAAPLHEDQPHQPSQGRKHAMNDTHKPAKRTAAAGTTPGGFTDEERGAMKE